MPSYSPTGQLGGLSFAVESTYNTDPATGFSYVHHLPGSTLGPRRAFIVPDRLGPSTPTTKGLQPLYVEGSTIMQMSHEDDVVGKIFGALGHKTAGTPNVYAIGGALANAPDNASLTCRMNYGKDNATYDEWAMTGLKPTGWRISCSADKAAILSVDWIGAGCAIVGSPTAVSLPADSLIAFPSDYTTLTFGGTAMQCKSFEIIGEHPKTGAERNTLGAFRQPENTGQAWNGKISSRFMVELTSETGYNTKAIIAALISTCAIGAVAIGTNKLLFVGGMVKSEFPALQEAVHEFPLEIEFDSAAVMTT